MQQDLTPKQQTSEAIRQAETILVMTGQSPTVDQVAAVLSLASILHKFGKKVSAIISDPMPAGTSFMDTKMVGTSLNGLRDFIVRVDLKRAEVDKLRYEVLDGKLNVHITPFAGGFTKDDVSFDYGDYHFDLAIVLGVGSRSRIDRVYGDNKALFESMPVLNVDFRRSNEGYGAVNLIEPNAASLCEILVATSESLQTGLIDADIATTMLAGLMSSTDRFTASHTTSKSMTVAAQLMAAGARQQQVVTGLFGNGASRSDRPAPGNRNDRPARDVDRPSRDGERPARSADKPVRENRDVNDRNDRPARDGSDRPARANDRDGNDRNDRPARASERDSSENRNERSNRSERPERTDRDARANEDRAPRGGRSESAERQGRDDAQSSAPAAAAESLNIIEPVMVPPTEVGEALTPSSALRDEVMTPATMPQDADVQAALAAAMAAPLLATEPEPRERSYGVSNATNAVEPLLIEDQPSERPIVQPDRENSEDGGSLLDPAHIQLTPVDAGPAPVSEPMTVDVPTMADFSGVDSNGRPDPVDTAIEYTDDLPVIAEAPSTDRRDNGRDASRDDQK